jgi:hypothetical protein
MRLTLPTTKLGGICFILQNQEPVTRRAAALKRAAQREKHSRAMQSVSSSRNSMLLWQGYQSLV